MEQEQIPQNDERQSPQDVAVFALPKECRPWVQDSFVVEFERGDLNDLGIEFNIVEHNELVVDGVIPDKLAARYNASAEPDAQIIPGDRVAAVNGWTAAAPAMLSKFSETERVALTFQHAVLCSFTVEKQGRKLGLIVNHDKKPWCRFLQVEALNEGLILEYNRTSGQRGLRTGDRIVEVNGIRGRPETLLRELGTKDRVELTYIPSPAA